MELTPARIIERAIADRAFPAAVVETGTTKRALWRQAFGTLTYEEGAPATRDDTIFDLASLTKVIATATIAMRAVDQGRLSLDERVAARLPHWRGADREHVTIADLLEHASGLTAYLPLFRDHHGRVEFERAICTMPLEYAPRTQSIYSDLGFVLLAFILEDAFSRPFAEVFDEVPADLKVCATENGGKDGRRRNPDGRPRNPDDRTRNPNGGTQNPDDRTRNPDDRERNPDDRTRDLVRSAGLQACLFNPPRELRNRCAPTELDLWRGRLLQGEVHDENCYVLGGAAGHAGLFGTAEAAGNFARGVLRVLAGSKDRAYDDNADPAYEEGQISKLTLERFLTKSTVPGSSRALGWDTMLPTSSCGTRMSARAIGHTGFTGTSLWIDPERDLYVVMLTNRVHPSRENNQIQPVRRAFHDAVVDQRTQHDARATAR